jgi:hypothetical protein
MSMSAIAEAVGDVGDWVWGLIQGNFNEQQTISQLLVDAIIGMIPVVGDVTAVRDLVAVIIRLVEHPDKRDDVMEWVELVIGCFALIPVAGGVIKGVGKLLLRVGKNAGDHHKIFKAIIELINRFGQGDAVAWFKKLDLNHYAGEVKAKFAELIGRVDGVLASVRKKLGLVLSDEMVARIDTIRKALADLKARGEKMIPRAIKDLHTRLETLQKQIHQGDWESIPSSLKSSTREPEARLVDTIKPADRAFTKNNMPHPPTRKGMYQHADGWPDLRKPPFKDFAIQSFSGKITARKLKAGTRIRRVIPPGDKGKNAGLYWMLLEDFPKSGEAWRKDFAVLERWSGNGAYVEYVVPKGGLRVWEGKVSSQIDTNPKSKTFGQYLPGGATQLLIDFKQPGNEVMLHVVSKKEQVLTHWTGMSDINVPRREATTQSLGAHEVAEKVGNAQTIYTAVNPTPPDDKKKQP